MKHYAIKLKEEIVELKKQNNDYYDAIYNAKRTIQNRNGLKATPIHASRTEISGDEEIVAIEDFESVCKIIEELP